jgi:hypothetical protein
MNTHNSPPSLMNHRRFWLRKSDHMERNGWAVGGGSLSLPLVTLVVGINPGLGELGHVALVSKGGLDACGIFSTGTRGACSFAHRIAELFEAGGRHPKQAVAAPEMSCAVLADR